jgi:hypothetical protein
VSEQQSSQLARFQAQASKVLQQLAQAHGLSMPPGHACLEEGVLHWRISIHCQEPESYWANLWFQQAPALGLGYRIEPGDKVVDQQGRVWVLLGLDPSAGDYPVRLQDETGLHRMASIEAAKLMQTVKSEKSG